VNVRKVDWVFAEIPVYRCHPGAHEDWVQKERLRWQAPAAVIAGEGSESFRSATNYFDAKIWYPWRYNELIGFIRLYVCGSQVRGQLWERRAKRQARFPRQPFYCVGDLFQRDISFLQTNESIASALIAALRACGRERGLRGRYIDVEPFRRMAEHIDWRRLVFG
jgi:hypothetical protein